MQSFGLVNSARNNEHEHFCALDSFGSLAAWRNREVDLNPDMPKRLDEDEAENASLSASAFPCFPLIASPISSLIYISPPKSPENPEK